MDPTKTRVDIDGRGVVAATDGVSSRGGRMRVCAAPPPVRLWNHLLFHGGGDFKGDAGGGGGAGASAAAAHAFMAQAVAAVRGGRGGGGGSGGGAAAGGLATAAGAIRIKVNPISNYFLLH